MSTILEAKNVSKTIKGHRILDNINFSLNKEEICGLVGRNASGKSMLFKALCGLITIDSGEIRIFDDKIGKNGKFPAMTGVIIEQPGFLSQYSGYENLMLLANIQRKIGKNEIEEALRKVGLDPKDKRPFRKYSLGMKQKLSIAQAIMESPKLLILDEPMNNLDAESMIHIRELLLELHKTQQITILLSSHNSQDIEILCNRVIQIADGKFVG